MEPLREPLWLYRQRFVDGVIPADILKIILQMVLQGLDYLHSECQIIHTDLKPDNILVKVEDAKIFERDALDEYHNPLPQKVTQDRTIYLSRNNYGPLLRPTGLVQIADLGLSVSGKGSHTGCIQAEAYRAPEVILDAGYTYSADIWSLGVMLWDLVEGRKLFSPTNPQNNDDYDDMCHLAQITDLLGPPPNSLLAAGQRTSMFYKSNNQSYIPPSLNFNTSISQISGEEKYKFLEFVAKLIRWEPEKRHTAKELLEDPWLYTDLAQT